MGVKKSTFVKIKSYPAVKAVFRPSGSQVRSNDCKQNRDNRGIFQVKNRGHYGNTGEIGLNY